MPLSEKTVKELAKRDARVLSKIQGRKTGIGFGKLVAATGLENNHLRTATRRLLAQKSIKMLGAGRGAFYLDAKLPAPAGVVKAKKTSKRPVGKVAKRSAKVVKKPAKKVKKARRQEVAPRDKPRTP